MYILITGYCGHLMANLSTLLERDTGKHRVVILSEAPIERIKLRPQTLDQLTAGKKKFIPPVSGPKPRRSGHQNPHLRKQKGF